MKLIRVVLILVIASALGYIIYDYVGGGFNYQNVMYHHMYSNQSDVGYFLNSTLMTIIIFSTIILIFSFKKNQPSGKSSVDHILDLRLSKGEISVEEYKELKEALK